MKTLAYYNGEISEVEEMRIPLLDRGNYFGDGVYDATMARNYKIFAIDEHVDRFFKSGEMLGINMGISKKEIKMLLETFVRKLESPNQFVYWQITRGTGFRKHVFPENAVGNLSIMLVPEEMPDIRKTMKVSIEEDVRFTLCHIKTLNLIPNVLASERGKQNGCDEVIFHRQGRVTECAHSNVHILKDGIFQTAPTDHFILPGIARQHLINKCGELGIPVKEEAFTLEELRQADEIIVSSSGNLCSRVEILDGEVVGGKAAELIDSLQEAIWQEFLQMTEAD